jgi:DNA-binding MarR family transcriptional regulator
MTTMEASSWRDDDLIAAWSGLLRLHAQLVPAIDADVEKATGLPLAWYDVLLELSAAPQHRLRMLDLGEAVVLSRTRVSRIVDELVAAGLVTRVPNPDDRRSAFAVLSPTGRAAFRRAAPHYLDSIRRHLGERLSKQDATTLRRVLDRALEP